jgi:hypothetical protein
MVTIYEKDSGKAVIFAHTIDAKESMATGFYVLDDPAKVQVVPEIPVLEEPAPVKIPTPVSKKPIVKRSPKIIKK